MELNSTLFVHGAPNGLKIWGPTGEDSEYIASLANVKQKVPEFMVVEIKSFGGVTYCYYSYIRAQHVLDIKGQDGSYFGLTLRTTGFYSDLRDVYNNLRTLFDKKYIGILLKETPDGTQYMVEDFAEVGPQLDYVRDRLMVYINEFYSKEDMYTLEGYPLSTGKTAGLYNVYECKQQVAVENLKKTGMFIISPYFLSVDEAQKVARYRSEMQSSVKEALSEIQFQKQNSQDRIDEITRKSQDEIANITHKFQEEMRSNKQTSDKEMELVRMESEQKLEEMRNTLEQAQHSSEETIDGLREKYYLKQQELEASQKELRDMRKNLANLQIDLQEVKEQNLLIHIPTNGSGRLRWAMVIAACVLVVLAISFTTHFLVERMVPHHHDVTKTEKTEEKESMQNDDSHTIDWVTPPVIAKQIN